MKNAPSQWLQYLTALSLSLTSAAYSLPAHAATTGTPQVTQQAAARVNDMAQSQVTSPNALPSDWLQIWIEIWGQVIIIIQDAQVEPPKTDFGSYKALLDTVKRDA